MAKSFRPRFTLAAFAVLAALSTGALIMGGNVTPYAAETPVTRSPAVLPPGTATPGHSAPVSVSPQAVARPAKTKSPPPAATTAPVTFIPPDALLSAGDVGPGVTGNEERVEDHGSLAATLGYCDQNPAPWRRRVDSLGFRQRWLRYPDGAYTVQELSRQPRAVATGLIPALRAAFSGPCATVPVGGNPEILGTFEILPSDWGDDSVLMRETRPGAPVAWRIAIRQGDLFTEIRTGVDGFTEQQARELGRRAAQRLCSATPTC